MNTPTGRAGTPAWLALSAGLSVLACSAPSAAQSGLAGTYATSPQRMEVTVSTWGEDCGTRPKSQVLNEPGNVVVKEEGAHLSLSFGDRTLHTNRCWSPNPSLTLVSATSANGQYQAECRTNAGDPKREVGRYSLSASGGKLELSEESDYDWQLKSSHCVAKVRVTQTLTAVGRASADAGGRTAVPKRDAPCVPSAPARLRLRPTEARIAPGERVCFVVRALDDTGCELPPGAIDLSLQHPPGVQGSLSGSCFKAAENAALAEGVFKVQATRGSLRTEASIVVSTPDLSDITARRTGSSAGSLGGQGQAAETPYETGVRAVAKSARDPLLIAIGVALLGCTIGVTAFLALRKARRSGVSRRPRSSPPGRHTSGTTGGVKPEETAPIERPRPELVVSGPQRICPTCRRGYPPGTERCPADGEALLDYDAFVAASAPNSATRFCPECGQALLPGSLFCGACGHKLVPG